MDETKGLEAPRKALQALRMKEEKLREALKKATTDAQKAKIKKTNRSYTKEDGR